MKVNHPLKKSVSFEETQAKAVQFPHLGSSFGASSDFKRAFAVPRASTPVPPTGLASSEITTEDFDLMDHRSSLLDLANAPPLYDNHEEMEVCPSGEKRKTTPPDLLTLSNMFFERNQVRVSKNTHKSTCMHFSNLFIFFRKTMVTKTTDLDRRH